MKFESSFLTPGMVWYGMVWYGTFVLLHKNLCITKLAPGYYTRKAANRTLFIHAFAPCFVVPTREQEIAYLIRPDERHTFPEHVTCGGSNSSGLDEDSWLRTSLPNTTVSSASDVAPHSDPRNEGSNGFGGDARANGRGKGKEKVTATDDAPALGASFNSVSAVSAATAAAEIYDLSGRRKKLTYFQEIYR